MNKFRLEVNENELMELIELVGCNLPSRRDLIPFYEKLLSKQPRVDLKECDFDYEVPLYEPKKK